MGGLPDYITADKRMMSRLTEFVQSIFFQSYGPSQIRAF